MIFNAVNKPLFGFLPLGTDEPMRARHKSFDVAIDFGAAV